MKTIGFIGTGNMGGALAYAISKNQDVKILLANRTKEKALAVAEKTHGIVVSNEQASAADFLFLGIKPQQTEEVLKQLNGHYSSSTILVSMVAGWSIERLKQYSSLPVIRIMPNTPVLTGDGMTLYCCSSDIEKDDFEYFNLIMEPTGRLCQVEEKLINTASVITGCGPAFADMFVDALADGAVASGVPRKLAIEFAAQMLIGSGKLILETGKHPGLLKDEVCSPGGSTIEGVKALENGNFRASIISAVLASAEKNSKL